AERAVAVDLHPVGEVEDHPCEAERRRSVAVVRVEHDPQHERADDEDAERRQQPQRAARVEVPQTDGAALGMLLQQQRRDEVPPRNYRSPGRERGGMADAPGLGPGVPGREGSNPSARTHRAHPRYLISGSRGRPRMRSPIWLRLISDVPPAIDIARCMNTIAP